MGASFFFVPREVQAKNLLTDSIRQMPFPVALIQFWQELH